MKTLYNQFHLWRMQRNMIDNLITGIWQRYAAYGLKEYKSKKHTRV